MNTIAMQLRVIQEHIHAVALRAGRDPASVKLLLATKTVPPERIKQAFSTDAVNHVAENKVQELAQKHSFLNDGNVRFHFIGHLQTNKVKEVLKYADCIHSVDRMRLVHTLDNHLQQTGRSMDILLQVNTSYENSKFGVSPEDVLSFTKEVSQYDTLKIKGLMTIGLFSAETEQVRKCFILLRKLKEKIADLALPNTEMQELSMGMSSDFETAIEEGATMVRIGTAIFGQRKYPDSYYWNEQQQNR